MLGTAVGLLLPFVLTPGASLALTTERAAAKDPRGVAAVIVGTSVGIVALTICSGFVGVVLTDGPWRSAITVVGGLVLVAFGVRGLLATYSRHPRRERPTRMSAPVAAGVMLANPKALTLYLAAVPAVMPPGPLPVVLTVVAVAHVVLQTTWLATAGWALGRLSDRSPRWAFSLGVVSAVALVVVGAVLVVTGT